MLMPKKNLGIVKMTPIDMMLKEPNPEPVRVNIPSSWPSVRVGKKGPL